MAWPGQWGTRRRLSDGVLGRFTHPGTSAKRPNSYGRIPNRVMLKDIIYNTTDGTPWFVIACEKYVKYSGDSDFISRILISMYTK